MGIPDSLVAVAGRFLPVELKVVTSGRKIKLSAHQVGFHLKHAYLGCPTFILVEYHPPKSSGKKPQILAYEGKMAQEVQALGIDAKNALAADLTPFAWDRVFELFCAAVK